MAVALSVLAARQVYQETHDFAVSSMDGDADNEVAMRLAVSRLFAGWATFPSRTARLGRAEQPGQLRAEGRRRE